MRGQRVYEKKVIMTIFHTSFQCVSWLAKFDYVILVQRKYDRVFNETPLKDIQFIDVIRTQEILTY